MSLGCRDPDKPNLMKEQRQDCRARKTYSSSASQIADRQTGNVACRSA